MSGPSDTPTVLVTGASGALGSLLVAGLPEHGIAVRGLDVRAEPGSGVEVGSVTDAAVLDRLTAGVAAVVHLAGFPAPGWSWPEYLETNIGGTFEVLEAARRAGVPRVVVASSNHAAGYHRRGEGDLPADVPVRPDSLYGVSKAADEALAAFYADEHGMRTVSLRIGSCFPRPTSVRTLASWLSPGDFVRLVVAALTGEWTGHTVVWGVSANTRRWWSLAEGRAIGYEPRDDAERYADEVAPDDSDRVGGTAPPAG